MKIQKQNFGGWGVGGSGQGGCEQRSKVFVKIQNINLVGWTGRGGVGLGVRVDVNVVVKFL